METVVPSQCPECRGITVEVVSVPPSRHDRGGDWTTRVECTRCDEYEEWID